MKLFAPARLRIERDQIVRINRSLKGKGSLNVSSNQQVIPSDILGTAQISAGFRIINLAQSLQVNPLEVQKYLKRDLGQKIFKGELLAQKKGGFLRGSMVVTSPTDGILDFLNLETGELRLTFMPKKEDLPAGVYGIVERVDQQKGQVIIRIQSSIVYGMFGSGKLRDGILRIISKRDELIGKSFISTTLNEQILAGGSLVFKEAIASAISAGVSGLIIGGINAKDYKGMAGGRLIFPKKLENDIGISVLVCEGFGSIPIGEDIYELLKKFDGKFVSIDGNLDRVYLPSFESASLEKVSKTKLVEESYRIEKDTKDEMSELKVGMKVRVIGNSYTGSMGKILSLDQTVTLLPSGVKSLMVTIETRHKKIQVPVANIEVIV